MLKITEEDRNKVVNFINGITIKVGDALPIALLIDKLKNLEKIETEE